MKGPFKKMIAVMIFGVAVYAAIMLTSDLRELRHRIAAFSWWTFGAALLLAFGNYVLRFAKWEIYLRRLGIGTHAPGEPYRPLPTGESFTVFLAGFVMSITPGKAGEVFRSALLLSARGVPVARSAPIVVADRLADLLSLIVLVATGSAMFAGYGWLALAAGGLVASVLVFVAFERLTLGLIAVLERTRPGRKLGPRLREAYAALRTVTSPGVLAVTTLISALAWGLECAALWIVLRGLGAPVNLALAFFAYATATIAGAIAMLPGGVGGTELTMRQMLRSLGGLSEAAASAGTLLVRLATLWFAVLVGFVALAVFRRRYDRNVTPRVEAPALGT